MFAPTNWPPEEGAGAAEWLPEEGAGAAEEAAAGAAEAGRLLHPWYRRPRRGLWQQ